MNSDEIVQWLLKNKKTLLWVAIAGAFGLASEIHTSPQSRLEYRTAEEVQECIKRIYWNPVNPDRQMTQFAKQFCNEPLKQGANR